MTILVVGVGQSIGIVTDATTSDVIIIDDICSNTVPTVESLDIYNYDLGIIEHAELITVQETTYESCTIIAVDLYDCQFKLSIVTLFRDSLHPV